MKRHEGNIREVLDVLQGTSIINTFLNTAVVFLAFYLFFQLINLFPWVFASAISLFYFVKEWIRKSGIYTENFVEEKFPFLKYKLTTAKDTLDTENFVVGKLREEVAINLKKVDAIEFFDRRKIVLKILLIISLTALLMSVTVWGFRIVDTQALIFGIDFSGFGKKDVSSQLDEKESDFNIIDVAAEENDKNGEEYTSLGDVKAEGAKEYKDPITEDERELVKNYFNRIQGETDGL